MLLRFTITLLLSIFCLATPARADFQAGVDAYERKDYATVLRELRPLAEQGDAVAQFYLGLMYDGGYGVPQDYATAWGWYEKAAVQGNVLAQVALGRMYYDGRGVPEDNQLALRWFRLAANKGNAIAQKQLGSMYENGIAVPRDLIEAHKWYNLAGANGNKLGAEFRELLALEMTPAQIAEAHKRAREWKPIKK
jgi:hypothetical protein